MKLTNPHPRTTVYFCIGNTRGARIRMVHLDPRTTLTLTLDPLQAEEFETLRPDLKKLGIVIS